MKKEIFVKLIKNYLDYELEKYVSREKKFSFFSDIRKIYTIIWPRRAGKTFFLYEIISNLLNKWVKKEKTLYMYLENDEIFPLKLEDLNTILETYFEIVWYDSKQKYYIFFDEIQVVDNWQKFATKVYQEFKNVELVLTWSTSKLLSSEISTWLRWKATKSEILPLTFSEVLDFKKFKTEKFLNFERSVELTRIFKEVLLYGSYPEIIKISDTKQKLDIIDDYFDLIFYKDIVERFNLKSYKKLKIFRKIILSYMTQFINYSEIGKKVWIDYSTVLNWIDYFEQAYFLYELKNFDFSVWKQETSISKIYILDNSYYSLNFRDYKQDYWILFENFVFMEFRKFWLVEDKSIFYFKNKDFDIDFLIFYNNDSSFIQVVYELNEGNFKREVEQLQKAQKKFHTKWYLVYFEKKVECEWVESIRFDEIREIFWDI